MTLEEWRLMLGEVPFFLKFLQVFVAAWALRFGANIDVIKNSRLPAVFPPCPPRAQPVEPVLPVESV